MGFDDKVLRYIPALNARPDHLDALAELALRQLGGWIVPPAEWDEAAARAAKRRTQ